MLAQQVGSSRTRANSPAYYHPDRTANQAANQHPARRASASFHLIAPVMASSLKFAFIVHVRVASGVSVNQRRINSEALAGWEDYCLRRDSDCRSSGDSAGFGHLRDAAFNPRAGWNQSLPIEHHGLRQASLKRVAYLVAEGC
jgi:hypothetical protein